MLVTTSGIFKTRSTLISNDKYALNNSYLPEKMTCLESNYVHPLIGLERYELPRDKTNIMACAPNEDSDQPGHPPDPIKVFAVRSMGS